MQFFEKIVEIPEVPLALTAQTSESLGTTSVCQMKPARIVDVVGLGPPLPADSAPPMCVTTPVVEAPSVVLEHVQPVLVAEYAAPASAMTFAGQASVVDCIAPALAVAYTAQARVDDYIAPQPLVTNTVPAPVAEYTAPVPVVTYTEEWAAHVRSLDREPVTERVTLRREAHEAAADRAAAELLAEEAAAKPAANGKHKKSVVDGGRDGNHRPGAEESAAHCRAQRPCSPYTVLRLVMASRFYRVSQEHPPSFYVLAMYMAIRSVLVLCASRRTTGFVEDSGDGMSRFVPYPRGEVVLHRARFELKSTSESSDKLL